MSAQRIVGIAVAVVIAVIVVLLVTTPSFSTDDRITRWKTEFSASEPEQIAIEPMADTSSQAISRFHTTYYRSPQQLTPDDSAGSVCRNVRGVVHGGNIVDRSIVRGGLGITWCWNGRREITSVSVNTWGEADGWTLWDYQGLSSFVKGHGWGPFGEYYYRRPYFNWKRGIGDFAQSVTGWVSITVRGTGGCVADRIESGRWYC